jgi:hypothetical protein
MHAPEEVAAEFRETGFGDPAQYAVEGAAWTMAGLPDWPADAERRAVVLDAMRAVESEPSLLGASGHVLTAAVRQAG